MSINEDSEDSRMPQDREFLQTLERFIIAAIQLLVDKPSEVLVEYRFVPSRGHTFIIKPGRNQTGQIVGRQGRLANAIRTIVKSASTRAGVGKLYMDIENSLDD